MKQPWKKPLTVLLTALSVCSRKHDMINIDFHRISKRLFFFITVDFALLIRRAQIRVIVRVYAGRDYQPGLIQKYVFYYYDLVM